VQRLDVQWQHLHKQKMALSSKFLKINLVSTIIISVNSLFIAQSFFSVSMSDIITDSPYNQP
jgi:hypothetical protein